MITPRLNRRALGHALQWRLLALFAAGTFLPTLLALAPVSRLLGGLLDRSPRAKELVASLDSHALTDVLRQLADAPTLGALSTGFSAATVAAVLLAPFLAGAALSVARADETVRTRALFAAAGEHYGRLLRLVLVGLVPLGIAAGLSGLLFRAAGEAARHALTEAQAVRASRLALAGSVVLVFAAQLTLDAGRAMFAAEPHRRSAVLAWWSGLRLVVRRPLPSAGLGLATIVAGGGVALALLLFRLRIRQAGPGTVFAAFVLAQLAAASIGWHRAARLVGFAELARADAADRERRSAFAMRPSPAPPAAPVETRSATLDALAPPVPLPRGFPEPLADEPPGVARESLGPPGAGLSGRSRSDT